MEHACCCSRVNFGHVNGAKSPKSLEDRDSKFHENLFRSSGDINEAQSFGQTN